MDPQELKGLADAFRRRLVNTLKKEHAITETPAPDVARLRFAITDLKQSRPDVCGITADGFDRFQRKKPVKTLWAFVVKDGSNGSRIGGI